MPAGTENAAEITMERWNFGYGDCVSEDKDWRGEKPELKHGFGSRYSWSNCIYDNLMERIKSKCECSPLPNCNTTELWKCASEILQDPMEYTEKPNHKCMGTCQPQEYKSQINSAKIAKDPKLCENWLTKALKSQCEADSGFESQTYSGLCNQVSQAISNCPSDTSYNNGVVLQRFAKEKLVSMNFYMTNPWMKTNHAYYIMDTAKYMESIMIVLAIFFGWSFMSLPEILYYGLCSRGGGCVCNPILQNC